MPIDPEVTGYVTIDGVTHYTCWYDADYGQGQSDLLVRCTKRVAPIDTRARLAPGEQVNCIQCITTDLT